MHRAVMSSFMVTCKDQSAVVHRYVQGPFVPSFVVMCNIQSCRRSYSCARIPANVQASTALMRQFLEIPANVQLSITEMYVLGTFSVERMYN